MLQKFTENTLVPVSMVIALIGGIGWLTMVYANGVSNTEKVASLETKSEKVTEKLDDIIQRLIRIEESRKK